MRGIDVRFTKAKISNIVLTWEHDLAQTQVCLIEFAHPIDAKGETK